MDTVENDAGRETFGSKGYANNAKFPDAHGGHCTKEVCNSIEPPSSTSRLGRRVSVEAHHCIGCITSTAGLTSEHFGFPIVGHGAKRMDTI
jgi:hypothetical protein